MRITTSKELPIGKIVYHVYGIRRTETDIESAEITKMVVLSAPKMVLLGTGGGMFEGWYSPFIDVLKCYGGREYVSNCSLHDMGVDMEGRNVYNLNRIFHSYEDAEKFIEELKADNFSNPVDQEYAERNPAFEELVEREYGLGF
ncbi:hypothetical protein MYO4S_00272 [Serratia phage 4S]|nr:hypothetical protein MYO4S_00272 [Serratia phage 4S]